MALVGSISGSYGITAVTSSFEPGVDNFYYSGNSSKKWSNVVSTAFTGSLTKLADGSNYLLAGTNITLATGSAGAVTITATSVATTPGGNNYSVQYNSSNTFGGGADLTWTYDTTKILGVNGQISASLGITGSEIFVTNLTPGQVVYGGTSGRLAGDSGMTYNDGTDVLSVGSSTFGTDVVVAGDLTVNGTTTTINTQNLLVKDPVILMGTGSIGPNANGGIAIFSGSTGASGDDLVFGRVANDTWGVGTLDTENGTVTSVAGMTLTNMRAATYEVGSTSATITTAGAGNMVVSGSTVAVSGSTVTFVKDGTQVAYVGTSGGLTGFFPSADVTYNLGSTALRWQNIYTGDLHLRNERGDYTLIEEEDFLSIRFNKTGKRYKFVLEPVPELDEK